ncbi:677_t:CDS:2 [Dentiscutata erythropus]|uniref:677_t:CDS:1 n=1 Tax=Dentiscutata erythropus TaxID=1348616 RepID=A0A9N8Z7T2_9GLOM|nr:677_t:CDS:2 [Dentiscutata erythropus]
MEKESNSCFSGFSTSDDGQKVVIMLNGIRNSEPPFEEPPLSTRVSSTSVSIKHNQALGSFHEVKGDPIVIKHETISGNHTTHVQKSTHRVEHTHRPRQFTNLTSQSSCKINSSVADCQPQTMNHESGSTSSNGDKKSRQLAIKSKASKNSYKRDEDADIFSDDEYDEKKADQSLLKLVKNQLLSYIEEKPSRKFKSGEYTWTEIKPYVVNMHFPRFRQYLKDKNIIAPNAMIFRCIKDLHISRRDVWLKKRRRERERRSDEKMKAVEPSEARSDGYVPYRMKT